MSRIERLTPEQEALLPTVRDEWLSKVFDAPPGISDRAALKKGIGWLYGLVGLEPPILIVLDSPTACQIGANMLRGAQVGDQVGDQVGAQVGDQVRAQVRDQVGAQVWDQVWAQVWAQVGDQVWAQVGDQVGAQVKKHSFEYFSASFCNLWFDADWCAFFGYFKRIGVSVPVVYDQYADYVSTGPCYSIMLRGAVILCGHPVRLMRDMDHRLHCERGPAVQWGDGYGNYFWHGVSIPARLVESPESITRDDIVQERNAEVRRCMMEKLGADRFAELLGVEEIHRSGVGMDEIILYRTKDFDPMVTDGYIQFVKVICPSTGREYMLCVPPTIDNALEAVAWTFGETPETYRPVAQT